ncbi:Nudix hydrolase 9 [Diplonema papillatum]|nr:Nudix hydrolase 9 [Diplonema papillatum]
MAFLSSDYVLQEAFDGLVPASKVTVVVGEEHNARTAGPLRDAVDAAWREKKAGCPRARLFNGLKFRLASCAARPGGGVTLRVGVTDYKDFIGTHYLPASTLDGCIAGASHDSFMSHALGVESILVTADGYVCLLKRSDQVAEYPNFYCGPGGHAEPAKVVEGADGMRREDLLAKLAPDAVLRELFQSAMDETADETGVPRESLVMHGLLGVMRNSRIRGKPDLLFYITTTLRKDDVLAVYRAGHAAESYESTKLRFEPLAEKERLLQMARDNLLTPATAAAVELISRPTFRAPPTTP